MMSVDAIHLNFWPILIAAVVYFILGAFWYSPQVFGNLCTTSCSTKHDVEEHEEKKKCCLIAYIGEFIIALIIAYVLALFMKVTQTNRFFEGITLAFWAWLGFIATTHFSAILWCRRSFKHYLVNTLFMLIGFILMGVILVALKDM